MTESDDSRVNAIYSSRNIEHLYTHEVPIASWEFLYVIHDEEFCVFDIRTAANEKQRSEQDLGMMMNEKILK